MRCALLVASLNTNFVIWMSKNSRVESLRRTGHLYDCTISWPLQYVLLLQGFSARIGHPFIPRDYLHCPPWCHMIARLLGSIRPHNIVYGLYLFLVCDGADALRVVRRVFEYEFRRLDDWKLESRITSAHRAPRRLYHLLAFIICSFTSRLFCTN